MNTIKLVIRGIALEVSTPADAFELIRLSEEAGTSEPSAPARSAANGHGKPAVTFGSSPGADPQLLQMIAGFLRAINSNGNAGVPTDRIVTALDVSHGKAIGGRLALINKVLEGKGISPKDVYSNKKTAEGRIWKPKKALESIISSIDQQLKTLQ